MSCLDGANPVFITKDIIQPNPQSPASGVSESVLDSYPALLKGAGYDCPAAKQYMLDALANGFNVFKNGSTIPALTPEMVVGVPSPLSWRVDVFLDSGSGEYYLASDEGVISGNMKSFVQGVDFQTDFAYYCLVGNAIITVPAVLLDSFDFDAWWCCASDCCGAAPVDSSRKAMQVLSNYTFQVNNSFGQVPKS